MTIKTVELVDAFADSVGIERAEDIINEAAKEANVNKKKNYTKEEALDLVKEVSEMDDLGTFTKTSASTLRIQIRSGDFKS